MFKIFEEPKPYNLFIVNKKSLNLLLVFSNYYFKYYAKNAYPWIIVPLWPIYAYVRKLQEKWGERTGRGSEEKENQEEKQRTCKKEKEYFCCYYMVDLERSLIHNLFFIIICLFSGVFDIWFQVSSFIIIIEHNRNYWQIIQNFSIKNLFEMRKFYFLFFCNWKNSKKLKVVLSDKFFFAMKGLYFSLPHDIESYSLFWSHGYIDFGVCKQLSPLLINPSKVFWDTIYVFFF